MEPTSIALRQVAQRAGNLDRAVEFYEGILGLALLARFDPPGLAFFDLAGTRLLLEGGAPSTILYLATDDLDGAVALLERRNVEIVERPAVIHRDDAGAFGPVGWVERMAFFKDSEGNTLAYSERGPAPAEA